MSLYMVLPIRPWPDLPYADGGLAEGPGIGPGRPQEYQGGTNCSSACTGESPRERNKRQMKTIASTPVQFDAESPEERSAPMDFATWHARLRGHNDDVPPSSRARGIGHRLELSIAAPLVLDHRAA
jgi:hypothetical protein